MATHGVDSTSTSRLKTKSHRSANMKYWCEKKYAPIPLSTFYKKYRRYKKGQRVGDDWFIKPGRPPLFTNEEFEKLIKEEQSKKGSEKLTRNELKQILIDRSIQMNGNDSHSVGPNTIRNYMNLAGIHDVVVKLNKPPKQRYWSRRKKVPPPEEEVSEDKLDTEYAQGDESQHFGDYQHNGSDVFI